MYKFISLKKNQSPEKTIKKIKDFNPFGTKFVNPLISEEKKKLNKFIKLDESDSQMFTGDLSKYKSEEFATNKRLNLLEKGVIQYSNTYN